MKKYIFLMIISLIYCHPVFAMFCPNGFNIINTGDSIATVQAQCGKADTENTSEDKPPVPQEWNYYIATSPTNPAKMRLSVVFQNNQAINISVNGAGISQTNMCGNQIQVGDTADKIQSVCGKPLLINQNKEDSSPGKATEITELQYKSTPPVTFIFENGKLKGKK